MEPATAGIAVGAVLLGLVVGLVIARRGRRIKVDWHLVVEANGDKTPPGGLSAPPEPPKLRPDGPPPDVLPPPAPDQG